VLAIEFREQSAGTHDVIILLLLVSYFVIEFWDPSAGTHGVIVFALVPRSRAPCARQRALPVALAAIT
jgi:hypothetical protein